MFDNEDEDSRQYLVVVNHEEQYSIWDVEREVPAGWSPTGFSGTKAQVLDHIREIWTDMRPKSARSDSAT